MNTMQAIAWLLPVIFMIHDFEEIFLIEAWKTRFASKLKTMKNPPYAEMHDTASFSIAIAIEFVLLSLLALFSCILDSYVFWFGMFFGFAFHLLVHFLLAFWFKHYVPGAATAIPCFVLSCWVLYKAYRLCHFEIIPLFFCCFVGVVFMLVMILVLHKLMPVFEKWVNRYKVGE
ncbi:MAG: HXXEE domain-containing protein [Erysipelotrichaceae bacterium]|jgi:hypothetical protein|nr:HXXEE domain-containing protein [Erysipelotrichaceae bacterium]